ncbi:hypothetical protein LIER_10301 [Lithospermum erythrorhizon]|uniref:Uncharacterized protein n=1 Tax=Lithospermum erythrorhizon TaxID=34254 RepID=A0AAV3PIX0_LITER
MLKEHRFIHVWEGVTISVLCRFLENRHPEMACHAITNAQAAAFLVTLKIISTIAILDVPSGVALRIQIMVQSWRNALASAVISAMGVLAVAHDNAVRLLATVM